MWGVRGRITALAAVVVLVVLAVVGAALVGAQRYVLTESIDETLQQYNADIASAIDTVTATGFITGQGDDEAFAEVVDSAGRVRASTAHRIGFRAPEPPVDADPQFRTVLSADGVEYRMLSQRHGEVVIRTATPLDDVAESTSALIFGLTIAVPATAVVLAVLVWLLVGGVLRPVEAVRRQVAEISGSSLERRVPEPETRDEIARLAHTMNEMLARLEASSARQLRFVADASHELRTPLTRMRTELEVDLAHPASADLVATHRKVLEETNTLQRLVEDLLALARSDSVSDKGRRAAVDLDDVVLSEVQRLRASTRMTIDVSAVSGAQVTGDLAQLTRMVRNLLDNAAQHGGMNVSVTLREEGGEAVLSITDDGAGVPEELQEQIFERFARVDDAREAAEGGSGLGLAITRELVMAHGGTVKVDRRYLAGAHFVVRLPLTINAGTP